MVLIEGILNKRERGREREKINLHDKRNVIQVSDNVTFSTLRLFSKNATIFDLFKKKYDWFEFSSFFPIFQWYVIEESIIFQKFINILKK